MVPRLSRHTQIAVVAGRDTCHAELWNPQDCSDHPTIGFLGSIPYEYWPGVSFHGMSALLPTSSGIQS